MSGSNLSRLLLKLFAQGDLAGTQVHDLAVAAWLDGWGRNDPLAVNLVKAGQSGRKRQQIANDIIKAAETANLVCSKAHPYQVNLASGGHALVFLPHEFYTSMVEECGLPALCLDPSTLEATDGIPRLLRQWANHEDVMFEGDLAQVGVLGIHCDGVQYTTTIRAGASKSVLAASMNVISAHDHIRHRRQPLFVLRKVRLCSCGCQGFHTIQELMDVVAWSMRCLMAGVAPSCRHDGSVWTDLDIENRLPPATIIPRACLLQVRGDWEWLEQCFRLRSVSSDSFCWMCDSTKTTLGPLHYHNFSPDAAHRQTLITHHEYIQACVQESSQPSHLFKCPGTTLDHLTVDAMHAADLGTFQDAVGSLFWLEATHKPWHRTQLRGLQNLNRMINEFYAAHPGLGLTKATPLVWTQILAEKPGYPNLKAKAAQTRHLAQFCLTLAQLHRSGNAGRPAFVFQPGHWLELEAARHRDLLVLLFEGFLEFNQSCACHPFVPAECRAAMYKYLQALGDLHRLWRAGRTVEQQRRLPFHLRQKAHVCQHMVEEKIDAWGSPSSFWCYRDEDFIGCIKDIARKTMHPASLEEKLIHKLRILAVLR
jgi:hypothetical protein